MSNALQAVGYFPFKDPFTPISAAQTCSFELVIKTAVHPDASFLLVGLAIVAHRISGAQTVYIKVGANSTVRQFTFAVGETVGSILEQAQAAKGIVGVQSTIPISFGVDQAGMTSKADLHFDWTFSAENPICDIHFNATQYSAAQIERICQSYQTVLTAILPSPDAQIALLPLLSDKQWQQMVIDWNATDVEFPPLQTHQLFEAQVERTPDKVAVIDGDRQFTYSELNRLCNRLASHLRRQGVRPEVRVGVYMERSAEAVVAFYAILKAGGVYVILDPSYPAERIAFMREDATIEHLLAQPELLDQLPGSAVPTTQIALTDDFLAQEPAQNQPTKTTFENLAYIIFTSGTTGRPKGSLQTHANLSNAIQRQRRVWFTHPEMRRLVRRPLGHGVAIGDQTYSLAFGGYIVIVPHAQQLDLRTHLQMIERYQINSTGIAPSVVTQLLDMADLPSLDSILDFACGTEAMGFDLLEQLQQLLPQARIRNAYGASEVTTNSTNWAFDSTQSHRVVSIGKPMGNVYTYLLDDNLQPVPVGVAGEICVGGAGVGRGYLNRPKLTQQRFIANPFRDDGSRLFKTGDLGYYLPDGNIVYISRKDDQVQIRGQRVELSEVRLAIEAHPSVRQCAVAFRSRQSLLAYVQVETETRLTDSELRQFIRRRLPAFMQPTTLVAVDRFPLSPNNKVDKSKLPEPSFANRLPDVPYVAPRTDLEIQLLQIWQAILQRERLGVNDNFYVLGGHSLNATQIATAIQAQLYVAIPISTIFEYPSVSELAVEIGRIKTEREVIEL